MKTLFKTLVQARRLLFPHCQETCRLQSEALDRPLSVLENSGLGFHLFYCKWCRRYGRQLRLLRLMARKDAFMSVDSPQQVLSAEARHRIKQSLHNEPV